MTRLGPYRYSAAIKDDQCAVAPVEAKSLGCIRRRFLMGNGIGGTVTCSPLPHHQDVRVRIRRFRGLRIATEEARETKRIEVSDGKGVRQGRTVRQTPRAVWAARRFCGESPI